MFSQQDYKEYFELLQTIEQDMLRYCDNILSEDVTDKTKEIITRIKKDEAMHIKLANDLLALLDG